MLFIPCVASGGAFISSYRSSVSPAEFRRAIRGIHGLEVLPCGQRGGSSLRYKGMVPPLKTRGRGFRYLL